MAAKKKKRIGVMNAVQALAENKELKEQRERLLAENQVWRELLAEFRDEVAQFAQVIGHSKGTERMRSLMASDILMAEEVDRLVAEKRAAEKERKRRKR